MRTASPGNASPDFRAISLPCEVPVLVDGDLCIVRSNVVLLHLARQTLRDSDTIVLDLNVR